MTDNRETIEMLKILKEQALKSHNDTAVLEVKIDSFNFVLDEAIKALEQQPCEDAISRKAVLDKLNKLIEVERLQGTDEMGYGRERVNAYESMIFEIESKYLYPSVNPQQPCEDCISRQEAINCATSNEFRYKIVEDIKTLPSVTPKPKIGRWREDANKIDAQFGRHTYICSECGKYAEYFISGTEVWWDRIKPNFCPNCGAKMEVENG
jgi:rubrerythrin